MTPEPVLSPDSRKAALALAAELGVMYGPATLKLLYRLLVDLDAMAQAVQGAAEKLGGSVGGLGQSLSSVGLSPAQVQQAQMDIVLAQERAPILGSLVATKTELDRLLGPFRDFSVGSTGWVV